MKSLLLLALLLAACSSAPTPTATGEFAGPTGLAVTSGGDRDLLFIANQGRDGVRALQLCLSPDGGSASDTCPPTQNLQFVPAPIRVFPANVETGDRPRRLAGVRLSRPDGSPTGLVLAVGADDQLRVVDARNLVEAANHNIPDGGVAKVLSLQLDSPGIDVVAETALDSGGLETRPPAGQTATAYAATLAQGTARSELLLLEVGVDAQGAAMAPVIRGACTLDPVVPRKLAVVPGGGDRVYVADGNGDGVVSVTKASIPPPAAPPAPCTVARIAAQGRAVRSLSVSPPWIEAVPQGGAADAGTAAVPHPAGELLLMVLEPRKDATSGSELDPGGILLARTADKAIAPAPPFSAFDATAGLQPMEPISTPGLPREAAFLRSNPSDANCPNASCTSLYVGAFATQPTARLNLVAAVTSSDGATYFVDVLKRRFVNSSYYQTLGVQAPLLTASQRMSVSTSDPVPPALTFAAPTPDHPNQGWFTAGVTHSGLWRVAWHSPFPGLENRSGALSASGTGTLLFKLDALSLTPWVSDPALQLAVGDTVSFNSYQVPAGAPQACTDLVNSESPSRFELTILSLPAAGTLELAPQPLGTERPFNFSACPAGLQAVGAVRAAGARPWLVFDGATVRGRAKTGEQFQAAGRRFDYPLDPGTPYPLAADNVAAAFLLSGHEPVIPGAFWSFSLGTGLTPLSFREGSSSQGFATSVLGYSSSRYPQLVFTSVTGANAVVQADTTILYGDLVYGVVSYK